jgi:hypothetical protein
MQEGGLRWIRGSVISRLSKTAQKPGPLLSETNKIRKKFKNWLQILKEKCCFEKLKQESKKYFVQEINRVLIEYIDWFKFTWKEKFAGFKFWDIVIGEPAEVGLVVDAEIKLAVVGKSTLRQTDISSWPGSPFVSKIDNTSENNWMSLLWIELLTLFWMG